jgi:predicted AAA+ superfamily ATPase
MTLPKRSFLLFGPRGTGKTTWLRQALPDARWYDLVRDAELVRLLRDPDAFLSEVRALPPRTWVVVDEVQRLPRITGDVQALVSRSGRWRFALTGSSARRLRREGANLLPARLVNRQFFPLTAQEAPYGSADEILRFGNLPSVRSERAHASRIDLLSTYVENYLTQEIRIEAAVRSLESVTRFLEVAALANGQVTNVSGIARDAGVARPTVQGYFDVLVDTLVGFWLPAWRPRARIKEIAHPKFYLFDPGVVRAMSGRLREPLDGEERGRLLETLVLHELRAYMDHASTGGALAYWRTPSGTEVDFVWTRARHAVGIEVKAAPKWRREWSRPLRELGSAVGTRRLFGVHLGDVALESGGVDVLPLDEFLRLLAAGRVIGTKRG